MDLFFYFNLIIFLLLHICSGGTCSCHNTLSYYGKDFNPRRADFCWKSTGCVESTCTYENEQKIWTKVSKGCTLDANGTCPRLKKRCLTDGGIPSADCSYCTGYKCNDKISPEIVWCWNGTVNDDKQAFTELKCEDASCYSLLCVGAENSMLFQSKGCLTLSKLWEMKLPFVEFGQTACKALNGTISRKLCDGTWCNAEQGQTEPGHTEPGHTEPGHTEPGHTEPGHTEPGHTEPGHTEPSQHGVRVFFAVPSLTLDTIVVLLLLMFG
uniref:Uncharacterized protein n=1 Tax=Globodera rostochiensis TaxID=31243 RepID=A0A914H2J8_GLORO